MRILKTNTQGTLYLHSMPGRYEPIDQFITEVKKKYIDMIFCLTSNQEIAEKSPTYFHAICDKRIPVQRITVPIADQGIPEKIAAFYNLAETIANRLIIGQNFVIHCAGGVGRTGMLAGCVLKKLELPLSNLEDSGSYPESDEQLVLVKLTTDY